VNQDTGEYKIASASGSGQGELSNDMRTLNGRIYIWKAAFEALRDNRNTLLWGTEYGAAEISYRSPFPVENAHNAWIWAFISASSSLEASLMLVSYPSTPKEATA